MKNEEDSAELSVCDVDLSDMDSIFKDCNGKAMNSVMRWNRSPYNVNLLLDSAETVGYRGFSLLMSKCDGNRMEDILRRYAVNKKKRLLAAAYDVLAEAEIDSLMRKMGYFPIEQVYDENDLDSVKGLIERLESSGVRIPEARKRRACSDDSLDSSVFVGTFGYVGASVITVSITNGNGRVEHSESFGMPDFPEWEGDLSENESELLRCLIAKCLGKVGWEREPDDRSITDLTSWTCRVKAEGRMTRTKSGYGDIPFNFDLLNGYLEFIMSKHLKGLD